MAAGFLSGTQFGFIVPVADAIIVLIMCVFIIRQPIDMFRASLGEVAGRSADPATVDKVKKGLQEFLEDRPFTMLEVAVTKLGRFYFDHWMEYPDYFQIFWAIDNESVIGDLPRDVIEKIAEFWEVNLNVTHDVLVAGVASGEFVQCDTWEIATILWSIANSLIESDNTKARRQIRRRPLEPLYMHAIDTLIRGILSDPTRVALAPPAEPRKSTLVRFN